MWIFSCDGDVLKGTSSPGAILLVPSLTDLITGKRLWIPPGKVFLIGRTAAEGAGPIYRLQSITDNIRGPIYRLR